MAFPDALIDKIMLRIIDAFHALTYENKGISEKMENLPFIRVSKSAGNRKCPRDLFDPRDHHITQIFKRDLRFPVTPYDKEKCLDVLKQCGLQTVVKPHEILDVLRTIGVTATPHPQHVDNTKFTRGKAVLEYICKEEFLGSLVDREKFGSEIKKLSMERSWIPVLAAPPSGLNYPAKLAWKGRGCNSHLMSLVTQPYCILSTCDCSRVPLLVGSQMYLQDPPLVASVVEMFPPPCSNITEYTVKHLQMIISCIDELDQDSSSISNLLDQIYEELMKPGSRQDVRFLCGSLPRWLYIKKQHHFVNPSVVAIEPNPTFHRQNLEPYIYLLPERLASFKELFLEFGMHSQISKSQIVSVLEKIRGEISTRELAIHQGEAFDLVLSILNWLTNNGNKSISDMVDNTDIYIPVDSDTDSEELRMENARDVVYSDSDFLKEFASSESDTSLLFSHPSIHQKLAECLGLRLLSDEMDISEDAFEDTGQHEPLTQRLKNILKGYKDGLTIMKELLQNADDAEATDFNICYDSRHHNTKKGRLLFQGMLEAHGPALVVHNNKTFSNDDFVNITKLAGATKEDKQLKIGKFGEGFCSVYHITDVPSFASRDQFHIFDPTLICLSKEVKNPNKPGKKLKFTGKAFSRSEQLNPYVGLFGFEKTSSFDGTLFRFPFRTCGSELSPKCYNEETVQELMTEMQKCASKLLLFLQNINCLTFWRIDQGQTKPRVLFRITKNSMETLPRQVQVLSISLCNIMQSSADISEHWLVATNNTTINGKHAIASVASSLKYSSSSRYTVKRLNGEVFCFLPLSQQTGLPVHISGNFAVMNNRQGIWTSDDVTGKADTEVKWNVDMMKHVIPAAYSYLLAALQQLHTKNQIEKYLFYELWPLTCK